MLWLFGLSLLFITGWLISLVKVYPYLKQKKIPLRAIYKKYLQFKEKTRELERFLLLNFMVTFVPWVWVAYLTYDSDHSYWTFLFPIIFYHYWSRFFLWEKSDLKGR